MNRIVTIASLLVGLAAATPASAQFGGGGAGGLTTGTGDAAAQNLPSTVGVGRQTGNGYYSGLGGGEQPYYGAAYGGYPYGAGSYAPSRYGRSAYRAGPPPYRDGDAYSGAIPYGTPRVRGYGYGFYPSPY